MQKRILGNPSMPSSAFNNSKARREKQRKQEQMKRSQELSDATVGPIKPLAGFLKRRKDEPCSPK